MNPKQFPESDTKIFITGPAGKLETVVSVPNDASMNRVAIICHPHPLYGGTMDNKVVTSVARAFNHSGYPAIRFNYRGVGESQGNYSEALGETEDLIAILDWILLVKPEIELWLIGFSFGAYVSARAAKHAKVTHLISIAPPVHHFDFINLPKPKCPWLVIQGDHDEIVPPTEVYNWIKQLKRPPKLHIVTGAGHFFHGRLIELKEIITKELDSDNQNQEVL